MFEIGVLRGGEPESSEGGWLDASVKGVVKRRVRGLGVYTLGLIINGTRVL